MFWRYFINTIEMGVPVPPSYYSDVAAKVYKRYDDYGTSEYDLSINPISIQWVDPNKIRRNTGRQWKPWENRRQYIGEVRGGDWDISKPDAPESSQPYPKNFHEMPVFVSFKNHFVREIPWEETTLFSKRVSEDGKDKSQIFMSLAEYDSLYHSIKSNGYKTQLELAGPLDTYLGALVDEILVDIGRNGEILFVDGRHRLSIAKILNIDKIPVFVLVRHEKYMTKTRCLNTHEE